MNANRRKAIRAIEARLRAVFEGELEILRSEIDDIKGEEQQYFDDMPAGPQEGERGQKAQAAINALESAYDAIDGFDFEAAFNGLEEACA